VHRCAPLPLPRVVGHLLRVAHGAAAVEGRTDAVQQLNQNEHLVFVGGWVGWLVG
jgi:hypothetical protein